MNNEKCPLCGKDTFKVIYYGFPMNFCSDENCNCMFGFWSFIVDHLPFNGWLFRYKGWYLPALWRWLINKN